MRYASDAVLPALFKLWKDPLSAFMRPPERLLLDVFVPVLLACEQSAIACAFP